MCCSPDYYYTKIDSTVVKARKPHECEACDDGVQAGERYVRTVCLSDHGEYGDSGSRLQHYKHCLRCWAVLRAVRTARPDDAIAWGLDCGEDWKDSIGNGTVPGELESLAFMTRAEVQTLSVDVKSGSYEQV